jgi:NAD(P)-dependent dehydrogenase (short-subunit alcohol dehydrogenase family)
MSFTMNWSQDTEALRGRVAVVAGATHGAGRGIAAALGEAGATVICTGRSTRSRRSEYDRAETIEETAELVTHLGGVGIAIAVIHPVPLRGYLHPLPTQFFSPKVVNPSSARVHLLQAGQHDEECRRSQR